MAYILGVPDDQVMPDPGAAAEDEAIRRAQAMFGPMPGPEPPPNGDGA